MLQQPDSSRTDWTMIARAAGSDQAVAREAMDHLARRYWPAIFAYLRSSGRSTDEAANLTQGFFCTVVLGRKLAAHADQSRGRFRSLLLSSLQNYLKEQHRFENRKMRSTTEPILRLDAGDLHGITPANTQTPEQAYTAQWAATLVRHVLEEVRRECDRDSLLPHWEVFEARVARPLLVGDEPVDYDTLCERLGIRTVSQASNMLVTIKRRFARRMQMEIYQTVENEADVEDELAELMRWLEGH